MTGHEPGGPARQRIGEIFVELGFITPDELDAALVVQGKTGALIGQILVDQGEDQPNRSRECPRRTLGSAGAGRSRVPYTSRWRSDCG